MNGYYLIGEHLGHSFSADIHRRFGRYDYSLKELSPGELEPFLEARDFAGLNVTIPYKEAVIPYLDRLDESAAAIGAVNTVVNRDGMLWGYNTDFGGMAAALARAGIDVKGKTVLILGTGGTSKTALAVGRALGAAELIRVSRTGREGALTYEEAYALYGGPPHPSAPAALPPTEQRIPFPQHSCANGDKISLSTGQLCPQGEGFGLAELPGLVVVNCTPVGTWPDPEGVPISLEAFFSCHSERSEETVFPSALSGVFDCVYNPLRTRLVLEAQARGIPAAGGLYMLVKQAALACELFTGSPVENEQVDIICKTLDRERENLVLIGMPGAGKTTVGRILAQKTGKAFADTDEEIVKRAGKPIPVIFTEVGETGFRDLEAQVVRELAGTGGRVIAAGGGTVLREENLRRLKQNGRLVFLDRPLDQLLPSPDRPLGDTAEKLVRLYAERYPIYCAAADEIVPVNDTPEAAAEQIAP